MPSVSAIIPTRRRPDVVVKAVGSALAETEVDEVIVVIDDDDPQHALQTRQRVELLNDDRLCVLQTPGLGNGAARNAGVARATGDRRRLTRR